MEKSSENTDAIAPPQRVSDVGENLKFDGNNEDLGAALFHEVQDYSPEELEAESAKVRRRIDWNIMPIVSWKDDMNPGPEANGPYRYASRTPSSF